MELFQTVCQIDGAGKRMFKVLTVKQLQKKRKYVWHVDIAEIIYEVAVEPPYKITRLYSKRAGNIRKIRGVAASSKSYSEVVNHSGNLNQRYVDHSIDKSKLTCLIYGKFHSSEQCKFLNDFGARYDARRTFKERRQDPTSDKMYKKNHDLNAMIQHAVSYILK